MAEKGLILTTKEERLAFVEGRQTQMRRVIMPQPDSRHCRIDFEDGILKESSKTNGCWHVGRTWKPKNKIGDHLYLKEPYRVRGSHDFAPIIAGRFLDDDRGFMKNLESHEIKKFRNRKNPYGKTSSRFMPKSLARRWFEVTGFRAERLQDITPDDILAEGLDSYCWNYAESGDGTGDMFMYADHEIEPPEWAHPNMTSCECIEEVFSWFWDSKNKKRGYGWDVNPWVWVMITKILVKNPR